MVSTSNLCLRCFNYNHRKENCLQNTVITCSTCYRINYLTRNCCHLPETTDDEYYQSFRMVGQKHTRFFIDVEINGKMIAALVNTNLCRSIIDVAVKDFIMVNVKDHAISLFNEISTQVRITRQKMILQFEVQNLKGDLLIMLGQDFLEQRRCIVRLGGIIIQPRMNIFYRRYMLPVKIYGF